MNNVQVTLYFLQSPYYSTSYAQYNYMQILEGLIFGGHIWMVIFWWLGRHAISIVIYGRKFGG